MTDPSNTPEKSFLNEAKLRPSEKVIRYLLEEFDRPDLRHGTRLPSNRELAERLEVSVPTVQGVLQKLSRQGRVEARRGSGTYLISEKRDKGRQLRVMLASPLKKAEGKDVWRQTILGGVMSAVLEESRPILVTGIPRAEYGTDASVDRLEKECAKSDGLIFMLPYTLMPKDRDRIVDLYERSGKPVVQMSMPSLSQTTNFVAFDHLSTFYHAGLAWAKSGRKRIYCQTGNLDIQYTGRLRQMGLAGGLGADLGEEIKMRISQKTVNNSFADELRDMVSSGDFVPDAIFTYGARNAEIANSVMKELGYKVPEDVSILCETLEDSEDGGSGDISYWTNSVTRAGQLLLKMLLDRIDSDGKDAPAIYLKSKFAQGKTTTGEENKILSQSF